MNLKGVDFSFPFINNIIKYKNTHRVSECFNVNYHIFVKNFSSFFVSKIGSAIFASSINGNKKPLNFMRDFIRIYRLINLKILPLTIIRTRSTTQMIQAPRNILMIAATILPSVTLVITPHTQAVIGMIARIRLTNLLNPK